MRQGRSPVVPRSLRNRPFRRPLGSCRHANERGARPCSSASAPSVRRAAKCAGGLIRRLRGLKGLLSNIDVADRYRQRFDDLGALQASLASDCAPALENGSLDESSVGLHATTVVWASLVRIRATISLHTAESSVALDAMEAAEAKQVTYLESIRACYEL